MYDVPNIPDFLRRDPASAVVTETKMPERQIRMPKPRQKKKETTRQKKAKRQAAAERRHSFIALLGYTLEDAKSLTEKEVDEIVRTGKHKHTDKG